jgi:hypothetical protein
MFSTVCLIDVDFTGFMKFCPVVPEICRGQVHGARKERRRIRIRIRIIIIRNGAKTISPPNFVWEGQSHIFGGSKGVEVTIESYGKLEISYINVDNF